MILPVDGEAPQVAVWRSADGAWSEEEAAGLETIIALPEIGTELPLADLYVDVAFDTNN